MTIQKGRGLAGGIYLDHSHPDISNCTMTDNVGAPSTEEATRTAGGLYNYYSSPTVRNCDFRNNYGEGNHSSICDDDYRLCIPACDVLNESSRAVFVDCSISQSAFGNLFEGRLGLGMVNLDSSVTIANCRFEDNVGGSRTHSPLLSFDSTVMVKDCLFSGNESGESGPSAMDFVRSTATIINTQFFDNRSIDTPTATTIYNSSSTCTIINSIFAVNTNEVAEKGCVLYNRDSECTIVNSTFADNFFYFWASGAEIRNIENSHCIIKNSIIWASNVLEGPNPSGFMSIDTDASSTLETSYSDIDQDGFEGANGNIRLDPKFVAAGWFDAGAPDDHEDDKWVPGDYHLLKDSPCIDAGTQAGVTLEDTDFEGDPRVLDGNLDFNAQVDMGADEFDPANGLCFIHTLMD